MLPCIYVIKKHTLRKIKMSEGLTPEQNEEAIRLGNERYQWGSMVDQLGQREAKLQAQVDENKVNRARRLFRRVEEITPAHVELEDVQMKKSAVEAGHSVGETNATNHYLANKDAYQEQAVKEAQAAGYETSFGQGQPQLEQK